MGKKKKGKAAEPATTKAEEKKPEKKDEGFQMAGTDKTWEYVVVATTPRGRVGYRALSGDEFRIRVEPAEGLAEEDLQKMREFFPTVNASGQGWKQPGENGQHRFSKVASDKKALRRALTRAFKALSPTVENLNPSSDLPDWIKQMV